ncbi:AI-2E family transporter [Stieleria varia]|nr:AI-2E family transporter [Stieleria varia]
MMQLSNKDSYGRIQMICQMVLAVVALTYSIYWLRPVLVPLVVALFVVSGVSPILTMLENRLGVSRIIAAGLTFLAGVVLLIVFGLSIWVSMVDLKNNSQAYRQRVEEIVHWGESRFREIGLRVEQNTSAILPTIDSERKGNEIDEATATEISPEISSVESPDAMTERSAKGKAEMSEFVDTLVRDGIGMISQALISLVSTSMVVLIYVFFLLIGTPSNSHHSSMVREIDHQVRSYLSLKTVISIFTGLAFGISLHLFGVPMAFTFGVLAFLLNFVPNIGPIVASLLPVPLIILDPDGSILWMAGAISVTCAIQVISGNLIEPKIMGNSSDLHPVTILVALMFWGMMWGVIGMFLATPITAAIKILLQRFDSTRPAADLMAGRWPASEDATAIA